MTTTLDIRTLLVLIADGTMSAEDGLKRIAEECEIPLERLIDALTNTSDGKTPLSSARWTSEDDATVITMWQNGEKASTIARTLSRTRNSVSQRVHYLRRQGHDLIVRETAGMNQIHANKAQLTLF